MLSPSLFHSSPPPSHYSHLSNVLDKETLEGGVSGRNSSLIEAGFLTNFNTAHELLVKNDPPNPCLSCMCEDCLEIQ